MIHTDLTPGHQPGIQHPKIRQKRRRMAPAKHRLPVRVCGAANHHQIYLRAQRHPGGENRNGESARHLLLNPTHDQLPRPSHAQGCGRWLACWPTRFVAGTATGHGSRRRQPTPVAMPQAGYGHILARRRVRCGARAWPRAQVCELATHQHCDIYRQRAAGVSATPQPATGPWPAHAISHAMKH